MKLRAVVSRFKTKASIIKRLSLKHEISSFVITKLYELTRVSLRSHKRSSGVETAIVIHLYYVESWGSIVEKLKALTAFQFDIFISLTKQNGDFKQTILSSYPNALIYESPNRGRDVLPFISIAESLYKNGYKHVLKIHSKKSTHRTDGEDWMNKLLEGLMPKDIDVQNTIIKTLNKTGTAMIGPKGQYVSLTVNFEANGTHMTNVVKKIYSNQVAHETLQVHRNDYGFFAGTMFWVNLEAIDKLLVGVNSTRRFETEAGQIDATFAHALERLFCVLPEIDGKAIYEADKKGVYKVSYGSGVVPDWSKVYIGPKPKA